MTSPPLARGNRQARESPRTLIFVKDIAKVDRLVKIMAEKGKVSIGNRSIRKAILLTEL